MGARRPDTAERLEAITTDIVTRPQRLEREQMELRAHVEGDCQVRIFAANVACAGRAAPSIGAAIERFAKAMRAPIPRGRTGGLARARSAWRYLDGTFMPELEKYEAYIEEYERYARGGRARAALARRAQDGRFVA